MAGVKGRSGRRPKSAALHLLEGTWRPDRHGPRPTATAGATALQPAAVPPVPKELTAGLREAGLTFLLALWAEYGDWTGAQLVVLREAAEAVDALEDYQAAVVRDGRLLTSPRGRTYVHPLIRPQNQTRATLIRLIAALNLREG